MNQPDHPFAETKPVTACPYCQSNDIIKKGTRKKKYETIQLYRCQRCARRFTPLLHKNHTYPLKIILDALTLYNRFYTLEDISRLVSTTYAHKIRTQTIAGWLNDFREYLPILRLRSELMTTYDTRKIFIESRLFHGQVYDFKCHYGKLDHLISSYHAHLHFDPLLEFLEAVPADCPHQLFREAAMTSRRSSRHKNIFSLDQVDIRPRQHNTATKNARFVLQAVAKNKLRHATLQEFMLINDSVTVAVEVPVLLTYADIQHFRDNLGFSVPLDLAPKDAITGHIDILQVRNGMIHILDYKPGAKKEKPIEQLTIYALALSRLTGLRLFHFKCSWFDDNDYFEFFPLHVVYKKRRQRK